MWSVLREIVGMGAQSRGLTWCVEQSRATLSNSSRSEEEISQDLIRLGKERLLERFEEVFRLYRS